VDQIIYVAREGPGDRAGQSRRDDQGGGAGGAGEMEEFMGRRVHLFLTVKVKENWLEDPERYGEMGLDFRDGA
jgi:GTP-binding protein Era